MNKKILFIISVSLLLVCVSNVSADVSVNVTYNITDLPVDGQFLINFSLAPNESIYFVDIDNDAHTTLTYPSSITLDENTSVAQFWVNYSMPFFADYSDNQTLIEDVIGVTNSVNTNLLLLKLQYWLLHPSLLNSSGNESYLTLSDGGKKVEVYTYSIIEFNQSHEIKVKAPNGATIDVTCGKYIYCPNKVNVSANNETSVVVDVVVPQGELGGTYPSYVTLTNGNNSGTINFSIIIRNDDISNLIVYDVWEESCYDSPENLAECYKKQAQYNSEVANALLKRLQEGNYTCDVGTEVNETIKYVEVGNIDPDLLQANVDLREKYNGLSNDYSILSTKYTSCMDDKTRIEGEVQQETETLSNEFILKRSNLEKETLEKEQEMKEVFKSKINWILGLVSFLFLLIFVGGSYLESQWALQYFPKKLFGIMTAILFVGWIMFNIFV